MRGKYAQVVTESSNQPLKTPPGLPKPLVDLGPAVVVGTVAWVTGLVVMLVLEFGFDRDTGGWPNTAIAGVGLGLWGLAVVAWQRKASRSGSRGAQRNL